MSQGALPAFSVSVASTLRALDNLYRFLEKERDALLSLDPAILQAVVDSKLDALSRVQDSLKDMDSCLIAAGYSPGIEGGDQLLLANAALMDLADSWAALKELSRRVAALNESNGRLVHQARIANRAALGSITGRHDAPSPYNKRGQERDPLPAYKLGEA